MSTSREPHRRPEDEERKVHVYVSSESSGIEKLTEGLNSLSNLFQASAFLICQAAAAAAVFAGVLVSHQEPAGPLISEQCLLIADQDSLVDTADELFWAAHPELNRRLIRKGEAEYEQEWWTYYKQAEECLKDGQF